MQKQLDRSIEMLKKMQLNEKIDDIEKELKSLADEQEKLKEKVQEEKITDTKASEKQEEINKKLGISGTLINGIVNSLSKLGISSKFFENVKEDMRDAADSAGSTKWSVFRTGLYPTTRRNFMLSLDFK